MSTAALIFGYFVGGLVSALLVLARPPARTLRIWRSAALALLLWPLWLPVAFSTSEAERPARRPVELRISSAVARARSAIAGTALEVILTDADARAIAGEVSRIARRLDAVERELRECPLAAERARARLAELAEGDARALDEVSELAELLATELTLARHGHGDGVEPLLAELRARLEALSSS